MSPPDPTRFVPCSASPYALALLRSLPGSLDGVVWRPVAGWEDRYCVSSLGEIWSIGRKIILRPSKDEDGRLRICFYRNSAQFGNCVHLLVCAAFSGARPSVAHDADHVDGDLSNNRADNLQWLPKVAHYEKTQRDRGRESRALKIIRRLADGEPWQDIAASEDCVRRTVWDIYSGQSFAWLRRPLSGLKWTSRRKLTASGARDIFVRVWAGTPGKVLAAEYQITISMVSKIKRRHQWTDATEGL